MAESIVEELTIEEACERIIDYRGKTPPKSTSGVKLLTAKVIKRGSIDASRLEYIDEKTYETWMRRGLPQRGDLLLTTEAPMGEATILRTDERVALAQRVILLRANPTLVDRQYLFAAMRSPLMQERLQARATGTTVLGIKQSELRKVSLPTPPLDVQKRIGAVIAAYDELIENNARRIEIVEEMVQTIYREWFVEFRFPGHEDIRLVDSDLGLIPEGWRVEPLGDVAGVNKRSLTAKADVGEILYLDISSVETGRIGEPTRVDFDAAPGRARRLVQHGDVIWSTVRPNRRSHALLIDPSAALVVSTGFAVLSASGVPFPYLYRAVTTDEFVGYLTNRATGAAYPAVTGKVFESAPLLVPHESVTAAFASIVEPMDLLIAQLSRANERLRTARDLLLPRLISGEIDVSDLDLDVGAAAA